MNRTLRDHGTEGTTVQQPAVRLRGVDMDYGTGPLAVADASFDLETGRFLTILGPSGSGKTTLLRLIAGFQTPTRGEILIGGRRIAETAPHRRSIGMVFQRLALFPHMTAAENVAFPLKMRRFDPKTIPDRTRRYLNLVRLDVYGDRRIHELSGGQQQRVAIARALVFEPDLLLLDEPLAALDRKLREEMQLEFRRIQGELGVTTINVTHDQREALVVSDDIIVMDHGRIQQRATPMEMYRRPVNDFVAGFVGTSTFVDGICDGRAVDAGGVRCAGTSVGDILKGAQVRGAIRAEQIRIAPTADDLQGCDTVLDAHVRDVIFEGERLLYEVAPVVEGLPSFRVYHHHPDEPAPFDLGAPVAIGWTAPDLRIFKTDSR